MSGHRSDMFSLGRICLVSGLDMSGHQKLQAAESRPGAKMMRLGPDKLTIRKLDNIELRQIMETTRSNLNSRFQISD
jgi:hypothetical protein